jgi:hypothetical protein
VHHAFPEIRLPHVFVCCFEVRALAIMREALREADALKNDHRWRDVTKKKYQGENKVPSREQDNLRV